MVKAKKQLLPIWEGLPDDVAVTWWQPEKLAPWAKDLPEISLNFLKNNSDPRVFLERYNSIAGSIMSANESTIEAVLLHEMAVLLARQSTHRPEWLSLAKEFAATSDRKIAAEKEVDYPFKESFVVDKDMNIHQATGDYEHLFNPNNPFRFLPEIIINSEIVKRQRILFSGGCLEGSFTLFLDLEDELRQEGSDIKRMIGLLAMGGHKSARKYIWDFGKEQDGTTRKDFLLSQWLYTAAYKKDPFATGDLIAIPNIDPAVNWRNLVENDARNVFPAGFTDASEKIISHLLCISIDNKDYVRINKLHRTLEIHISKKRSREGILGSSSLLQQLWRHPVLSVLSKEDKGIYKDNLFISYLKASVVDMSSEYARHLVDKSLSHEDVKFFYEIATADLFNSLSAWESEFNEMPDLRLRSVDDKEIGSIKRFFQEFEASVQKEIEPKKLEIGSDVFMQNSELENLLTPVVLATINAILDATIWIATNTKGSEADRESLTENIFKLSGDAHLKMNWRVEGWDFAEKSSCQAKSSVLNNITHHENGTFTHCHYLNLIPVLIEQSIDSQNEQLLKLINHLRENNFNDDDNEYGAAWNQIIHSMLSKDKKFSTSALQKPRVKNKHRI